MVSKSWKISRIDYRVVRKEFATDIRQCDFRLK